jgi:hypothetical protein
MITLFIWTAVAGWGDRFEHQVNRDWRSLAQFETIALCEDAARSMNIQDRYRCLKTK